MNNNRSRGVVVAHMVVHPPEITDEDLNNITKVTMGTHGRSSTAA
jgi:hypothetical protein